MGVENRIDVRMMRKILENINKIGTHEDLERWMADRGIDSDAYLSVSGDVAQIALEDMRDGGRGLMSALQSTMASGMILGYGIARVTSALDVLEIVDQTGE